MNYENIDLFPVNLLKQTSPEIVPFFFLIRFLNTHGGDCETLITSRFTSVAHAPDSFPDMDGGDCHNDVVTFRLNEARTTF